MKSGWTTSWRCASALACVLALAAAGCGSEPRSESEAAKPAEPPKPAAPQEIQAAAEEFLGSEAEVLLWGDLARTGAQQALLVNRLKKTPEGMPPGTYVTRVAVIEKSGGAWKEVFRCDQHLRNPKGYLGGTPVSPVPAWRLQYEESEEKGLVMYFRALARPAGGNLEVLGVRWDRSVGRYRTLDRNYEKFQGEAPTLERIG